MPPRLMYFVATVSLSGIKTRERWEKRSRRPGKAGGGQGTKRGFSGLSEPIVPPKFGREKFVTTLGQYNSKTVEVIYDKFVDAWCLSLMGARGVVGRMKRLRKENEEELRQCFLR